ncbi:hypothetical protein R5R35_000194 [Gryllus longicercus]|uniref:Gem-associated protein 5 n=1 Tax=Gryllus longicercus TaxID=2509291 RepID=A0AAN9W5V6_9ORTH
MNEQIFPPSPNWYLSNAFACDSTGTLAYGNRNNLVIVKTNNICDKSLPKVEIVPAAHKERVTVVVFSPQNSESTLFNCIATSGDDAVVKVWDLLTMTPILANISHGNDVKVSCMDWSVANSDLIVSMDDNNNIVCWDLPSNSTHSFNLGKLSASTLSCCPHNKDLIAIGCRSGLVCIINIQGRGKILFRMRGHDSEVVSLAWCPVGYSIFDSFKSKSSVENQELFLASAAKERTIFLWRANSDGRYELALSIPTHLMAGQRSNKGGTADMNWVSLCWPQANTLICSTRLGRVIAWDLKASFLNKSGKNSGGGDAASARTWHLVHSSHNRIVFNIVTAHKNFDNSLEFQETTNWRQTCSSEQIEKPLIIWSSSQDRLIVGYDLNANKEITCVPTIGGIVYCIAASPIDPNRIAFGVSDAVIRVWNLSSSSAFDVSFLWQKVRGKVTSVAWHPTQESRLAFGTAEGRVGIFDTLNSNKPPVLLRPYHTKSLYVVGWGPALFGAGDGDGPSETKYTLYSCGEGDAVQYDIHNPEAEAKNLNDLPPLNAASRKSLIRTDLAWKPDNSILALGNEDGSVQLVTSTNTTVLHTIYAHKNLVQSLAWHPEGTATDTGYSPCQHWLAVASKKSPIKIFNLTSLIENGSGDVECVAVFSQHKQCVVGMCWSPHVSGQLLSVSFDETAQIWDVLQQQPIGNYSRHAGVLHSGCWSPLDPDLVLTGSADSTLRVWRISSLDRTVPFDKKKEKNAAKKSSGIQLSTKNNAVSGPEKDITSDEAAVSGSPMPNSGITAQEHETLLPKSGRQKARSYFPVWAQIWQGSASNILDRFQTYLKSEDKSNTEANLLGIRTDVLELLKLEESQHSRNGNLETIQHIALWKGDIGETIRESARKKKLTDWLVSMAPMVSQRLWLDTCRMYAEQLTGEGRIHKAASYLLACHKVEEAIQLFLHHHLFREALTVAKLRLSEEDPLTISIVRDWSQQQILDGHYERAAECLMSVGDLPGAAEILGKRNDARCLWLAADIAHKSNLQPVALCYAKNCIIQSLLHKNWELALKVTTQYSEFKSWTIVVFTHQSICELLTGKLVIQEPITQWIFQQYKKEYEKDPTEFYKDLEKSVERNVPDSKSKLWLAVSADIALSSCAVDEITSLQHLVQIANMCYQFQLMHPNVFPLLQYLRWLAPHGVLEKDNIFKKESEPENLTFLRRSLRFYLYAGYFSWLQAELSFCGTDFIGVKEENDCILDRDSTNSHLKDKGPSDINEGKITLNTNTGIESETNVCNGNEVIEKLEELSLSQEKSAHDGSGDHKPDKNIAMLNFNWKDLMVPLLTSYSNELPLEAAALAYYKQKVEIKKWEQEVASLVAQQHQSAGEEIKNKENLNQEQEETKMLKGLKKLDELKELKETFEKQQGSTPNPFVTYCHFTSICDLLIKEKGLEVLRSVSEVAVKNWQTAASDIK